MARIEDLLESALMDLPPKPPEDSAQADKRRYSEVMSQLLALAFAEELRQRGMAEARPAPAGVLGSSGAERRLAGGIGAKKVDVTWATEESGLMLGLSVKTINWRDARSGAYQKNLTNRRGDMLIEAVTLHRRFPYAVLGGFLFLDAGGANDGTARRKSTFRNAFPRLRLFTGRSDPAGRDEQYERLYLALVDATPSSVQLTCFQVSDPDYPVTFEQAFDDLVTLTVERNFDLYEVDDAGDGLRRV